jgi:hypothetical protein
VNLEFAFEELCTLADVGYVVANRIAIRYRGQAASST